MHGGSLFVHVLRSFLIPFALAAIALTAGCGGGSSAGPRSVMPDPPGGSNPGRGNNLASERALIKHVVIIVQENRSFDNMFNGYPNANSAKFGTISTGQVVQLQQVSLAAGFNISHKGKDFFTSYDKGKLDGFNLVAAGNVGNAHGYVLVPPNPEYSYVPPEENKPYWTMASQYTLADDLFQSNIDASFVAHQYLIRGWANSAVDNPAGVPWDCKDAPPGQNTVSTLLADQKYGPMIPACFDGTTIGDELEAKGDTWHFYSPEVVSQGSKKFNYGAVWSAYGSIRHIRFSSHWGTNVRWPETSILNDVPQGELADVTWVTPKLENSDHPSCFTTNGPSWVSSIVNQIGNSKFWPNTVIFVVWDDAGNWYDHVPPPLLDYDGPGFRVPLIAISPYSLHGQVVHTQYETASILKFVENLYGLPSIAAADTRAADLSNMFDFSQTPSKFQTIPAPLSRNFFLGQPTAQFDPPDDL
jgi:phospholipase C